ncbi:MAG: hypothetical protein MHM6MM_004923 [Cercozoa sp. M6MM]
MSRQTYASTFAENGLRDVSNALVQSAAIRDTGLEKGLRSLGESLRAAIHDASANTRAAVHEGSVNSRAAVHEGSTAFSDSVSKIVAGAIVIALIWGALVCPAGKCYEIKSRQNRRSPPEDRN